MIIVMFLFGEPIVSLFVNEPEVIEIGAKGLRITSLMYFGLGMIYIMQAMLNGAGDAAYAMANGFIEVAGRIGFAYLLMLIPGVGMWGIWYTNGLTWTVAGTAAILRFLQGKWKTKSIVHESP